ncbi:serine hydrolase domain-containing protein [Aurantiacibacter aquimixticola]|uniref:Class A beta-lactamase-related serine hydrolase n=1 Tax=Aurantiacibacter aquimixticola TaxID=1958945 RepID=A0A419RSI9_9SPHN|nr:serine hydrolase domain-containing protein [Aurantiacibacter aquimixticola]RJY08745.1 class A beta-lactamase-related serine hydrolase [Aurantiacibacter aquimixticola]
MKKWLIGIVLVLVAISGIVFFALDRDQRALLANMPTDRNVLFWSVDQRNAAFRALDAFPALADARVIEAGDATHPLPEGEPLDLPGFDLDGFMQSQNAAAVVVVHDGAVVLERYGLDFSADGKWTSFSVAKSLTSTLVGAALKDGHIDSLEDPVSKYLPDMRGSAYDDVTIRHLLTMSSGVRWNEDYTDPESDVARFNEHVPQVEGVDALVDYMRQLPREAEPGTRWQYNTGETNLIGVLVREATGKTLADYLSEKVWQPFGMAQDATWILSSSGSEISGCCIQASTRDMARFGLFALGGGMAGGERVVPEGWFEEATQPAFPTGRFDRGYAYQWWTYPGGAYAASGLFGQGIFVDPERNLVIATNSNWRQSTGSNGAGAERNRFYAAVQAAVDARRGREGVRVGEPAEPMVR